MTEAFSIKVEYRKAMAENELIAKAGERAAMFAVREAGRIVRREMKAAAPKDTGALRRSIKASRRITVGPGTLMNKVGPKGNPTVHKYAYKAEAAHGFAALGASVAEAEMPAIMVKAIDKALLRFR